MKRLNRWCAIALFLATPSAAQQYDPGDRLKKSNSVKRRRIAGHCRR